MIDDRPPAPDDGIRGRYTRVFDKRAGRVPSPDAWMLLMALCQHMNTRNIVSEPLTRIARGMGIGRSKAYQLHALLKEHKILCSIRRGVWMLDPNLVFRGKSKYHRATRMQYGIALADQLEEQRVRRHDGAHDEQPDLPTRSGHPDDPRPDARA